jgi:type II secretory pathway pseudopilin PulG
MGNRGDMPERGPREVLGGGRGLARIGGKHTSGAKAHIDSVDSMYGLKPVPFIGSSFFAVRKANTREIRDARSRGARMASGESGYILLAVLFLMVMVLIMLSLAAPKMAADIERDREVEMIHRGNQYVRAIKLYYKKFGAYPPNMDALVKSNEIRFLRKRYKDPITGKDEWHLIHFGENKTPSMGFFGQAISGAGGSALAGVGPGGVAGASTGGAFGSSSSSIFGNSSTGGSSSIGSSSIGSTTPDPNAGTAGATGTTTGTTATGTATGTGTDSSSGTGTSGSSSSTSAFGSSTPGSSNGLTVGGLGIIGVESTSPKLAILEWKKKKHFNEWEFWYDPNADRVTISGNTGTIGQPAGSSGSSFGTSGTSSPSMFNQPTNSPAPAPAPTQPQPPSQPQQQ